MFGVSTFAKEPPAGPTATFSTGTGHIGTESGALSFSISAAAHLLSKGTLAQTLTMLPLAGGAIPVAKVLLRASSSALTLSFAISARAGQLLHGTEVGILSFSLTAAGRALARGYLAGSLSFTPAGHILELTHAVLPAGQLGFIGAATAKTRVQGHAAGTLSFGEVSIARARSLGLEAASLGFALISSSQVLAKAATAETLSLNLVAAVTVIPVTVSHAAESAALGFALVAAAKAPIHAASSVTLSFLLLSSGGAPVIAEVAPDVPAEWLDRRFPEVSITNPHPMETINEPHPLVFDPEEIAP